MDDIIGKAMDCVVHPDDRAWMTSYASARHKGERAPSRWEFMGIRRDGKPIDVEISVSTISHGGEKATIAYLRDITIRKRSVEALRQTEEKYRSIVENAVEGIFQTTPEGRFVSANPALAKLLGYDSPQEPKNRLGTAEELVLPSLFLLILSYKAFFLLYRVNLRLTLHIFK